MSATLATILPAWRPCCADYGATLTGVRRDGHNLQLLIDCTPAVPLLRR
jgi:hypothetical protein